MPSFWELESFIQYDYAILGGGIVGLSTAIELKQHQPEANVVVVERGVFPSGASTKNAGFACFGSLTEILADLEKMTDEEVLALVKQRWEGLQLLRERLGNEAIDYRNYGGYELLRSDSELAALDQLDRVNELLHPLFGKLVYRKADDQLGALGFNSSSVRGLVFNNFEGQIHTGKMMKALQRLAAQQGIDLITGAEVAQLQEESGGVRLKIKNGSSLQAQKLAICTNAFTGRFLNLPDFQPGRGVVLVTEPIADLPFKGTFHYDEGFYYFRNYGDRIIFGGGRNLDIEGEATTDFGEPELILEKLKQDLRELILPGRKFEVAHTWSGIMAFGHTKQPIVKKHSERIYLGVRLGGMGVAIGSLLGKELADLVTESANN